MKSLNCDIPVRMVLSFFVCLIAGCGAKPNSPPKEQGRFRVAGPSMNPTLWDVSFQTLCPNCEIPIRIDASLWERAVSTGHGRCWHCGSELDLANTNYTTLPPDEVGLTKTPIEKLMPGDLVLLRHPIDERHGDLHVKRILAIAGQTVSIDDRSRLLVDGQVPRFETAPKLLVDSGRYRLDSRWQPIGDRWWRYEHRLVHRGNRPGPILDDYPGNLAIDRLLNPVSSISVRAQNQTSDQSNGLPAIEEIRLWHEAHKPTLGLSSESPVAVRLREYSDPDSISSAIKSLRVYREIVYLDTPTQTPRLPQRYPVTLAKNEFFVVGDNVPLSLDSRSWGPIQHKNLIGQVLSAGGTSHASPTHAK